MCYFEFNRTHSYQHATVGTPPQKKKVVYNATITRFLSFLSVLYELFLPYRFCNLPDFFILAANLPD